MTATPSLSWSRITVTTDGVLRAGRHEPGRGAWVCSLACFDQAVERGALDRALRRGLASTDLHALRARLSRAYETPADNQFEQ
jgi:predicted RNA-binding protein YlxR (DUF448 family)